MQRTVRAGATILALGALAACGSSSDTAGFGALTVADLDNPPIQGHFTAAPAEVTGTVGVTDQGCVTVTVDGVTRMAFWPAGTRVVNDGGAGGYSVTIPGGPTLHTDADGGDTFRAVAVVDEGNADFVTEDGLSDSKAAEYLRYCDVDAAPIAFFEPDTVAPSTA